MGESFWQNNSLITHILFELWLITLLWIVLVFFDSDVTQKQLKNVTYRRPYRSLTKLIWYLIFFYRLELHHGVLDVVRVMYPECMQMYLLHYVTLIMPLDVSQAQSINIWTVGSQCLYSALLNGFKLAFPTRRDSPTFFGHKDRSSFIFSGQRDNQTISKSCQGTGRARTTCQDPRRIRAEKDVLEQEKDVLKTEKDVLKVLHTHINKLVLYW